MRNQDFPCLFVNLSVIRDNARTLIALCRQHGVEPVGVNKLSCEAANVARAMIDAGISTIADSRIQNLKKIADLPVDKLLLRLPQISLAHDIVAYADISLNSEEHTLQALSAAALAQNKTHRVILMHDLGDLREGCMDPQETRRLARLVHKELPGLTLEGLGANLACYGGVEPTTENQQALVDLAHEIEDELDIELRTISGASSAALFLLINGRLPTGVNQLRLGASLIMGFGLNDEPIPNTRQDAIKLGVEIIELKDKPSVPQHSTALDAMGRKPVFEDLGVHHRALAALGEQDVSFSQLRPFDPGVKVLGASSDHLILDVTHSASGYQVGDIVYFSLGYSGVLQCMTSEYVGKQYSYF
ncbi:TPA: alanine/ornithine racemase family PLP-dependent enzyme [Citrobacter farmeri]